ncbi:MAG: hypothetical protein D6771_00580 [Zetaproteobacteria bacterium]|nr:MAG: hypothetical protein D6771_00580 [Zetaproteobacteria bacterium]
MTRLACGCPSQWPDWRGDVDLGGMLVHEMPMWMFLHMPVGFEAFLDRQVQDIARIGARERWPGFVLVRSAMFRGALLAPLVDERIPARRVRRLAMPFWVRVQTIEGEVGAIKPAIQKLRSALIREAKMPKELYLAYLTCPHCAEARGGSKIMVLQRWRESPRLAERLARRRK